MQSVDKDLIIFLYQPRRDSIADMKKCDILVAEILNA